MRNEDSPGNVKQSNAELHLCKDEKGLIEEMRRGDALEEDSRKLPLARGVSGEEILYDFRELGYSAGTVQLLFLAPAVQIAWAEGWVAHTERKLILEAARQRGIEAGSLAYQKLSEWLCERPPDHLFELALAVIGAILSVLRPDERSSKKADVFSLCVRVADASGLMGFLGSGSKVTRKERELLKHITEKLEQPSLPRP